MSDVTKKRGKKHQTDVCIFLKQTNALFDIYQHDPKHFSDTEKKHMLKMNEPNFQFYEDQKIIWVQYYTLKLIPSLSSDLKSKNYVIHSQRIETKIISDILMESCAKSNSDIDCVPSEDPLQN